MALKDMQIGCKADAEAVEVGVEKGAKLIGITYSFEAKDKIQHLSFIDEDFDIEIEVNHTQKWKPCAWMRENND